MRKRYKATVWLKDGLKLDTIYYNEYELSDSMVEFIDYENNKTYTCMLDTLLGFNTEEIKDK